MRAFLGFVLVAVSLAGLWLCAYKIGYAHGATDEILKRAIARRSGGGEYAGAPSEAVEESDIA